MQRTRVQKRIVDAPMSVGKALLPQRYAVSSKLRRKEICARDEILARFLVRRSA